MTGLQQTYVDDDKEDYLSKSKRKKRKECELCVDAVVVVGRHRKKTRRSKH